MHRARMIALFCSLTALAAPAQSPAATQQATVAPGDARAVWEAAAAKRRNDLMQLRGTGADVALRDQLLAMGKADQDARGIAHGAAVDPGKVQPVANLTEVDAQSTAELKAIVEKRGWPTIALVGIDASNAAMVILTHSRDHAWQLSLLPQLEELADTSRIDGATLALVVDKELVSEGKLQRYGTQFKRVDDGIAMLGVEDPAGLDKRRAQLLLPPMAVYKALLADMYHLPASNRIVSATAAPPGA